MNNIRYIEIGIFILLWIGLYFIFNLANEDKEESIGESFLISMIIIFCIWIGVGLTDILKQKDITYTYSNNYELKCLRDYSINNEKLEGVFILGCGSISSESENTYTIKYASNDNKGICRIYSIDGNNDKFGFVFDGKNTVEVYTETSYSKRQGLWKWLYNKEPNKIRQKWKNTDYVFHIPQNGMISDSKIDLQ